MRSVIIAIFLMGCWVSAAQIKVEGVVKDSIGAPLELANVIAINQDTKALDSYAITNDQGLYRLNLKPNATYNVQVSYIGKKTANEELRTGTSDVVKDFTLLDDNTLDTVELTYEMPVSVKGDTLVYNADSFRSETDRKLEDVLKRLPGVEVTDDGTIEVEGKEVSKVMVEGKDFFCRVDRDRRQLLPRGSADILQGW